MITTDGSWSDTLDSSVCPALCLLHKSDVHLWTKMVWKRMECSILIPPETDARHCSLSNSEVLHVAMSSYLVRWLMLEKWKNIWIFLMEQVLGVELLSPASPWHLIRVEVHSSYLGAFEVVDKIGINRWNSKWHRMYNRIGSPIEWLVILWNIDSRLEFQWILQLRSRDIAGIYRARQ